MSQEDVESFESQTLYDVVLAEGFLFTLPTRAELIQKICALLKPGGLAVISFIDRYGCLLEITRKLILHRACQLAAVDDPHSKASLEIAKQLYGQDFSRISVSRPFEAWWKDSLVNPLFCSPYLWSYEDLLPLVEEVGCEFYSSSPQWNSTDHFSWYKQTSETNIRHQHPLKDWARVFPYFITGIRPLNNIAVPPTPEVLNSVFELTTQISEYVATFGAQIDSVIYPHSLEMYLNKSQDPRVVRFNSEMKNLYAASRSDKLEDLVSAYHESGVLRNLWGTHYHYICFSKQFNSTVEPRSVLLPT